MATEMRKTGGGRLLNNMTTGLTVAPLILMTAEGGLAGLRRCRAHRYVEFALLAVGLWGDTVPDSHMGDGRGREDSVSALRAAAISAMGGCPFRP